ncbi:protein phosphatase [Gregarina niphandrodes]|uniref:protein-serine/threonine phosphatase n=1 Tax=Gregarina niphandrodes TaxID=110365 RepID=A0A023B537_GRENI|nr:protein phosphatase [Gregarina niphandrodes]EZG58465.1 protein phosphatase [Gregarina niphandrodes]|eukprot:XP_011130964.1 protein phosphatase [Gregarina niphandrodes]
MVIYSTEKGWISLVHYDSQSILDPARDCGRPLLDVTAKNPCVHNVVLNRLCASCGEIVEGPKATTAIDDRIQISKEYAETLSQPKIQELYSTKKLILVLDLDHTLIHAEQTPPHVELLRDNQINTFQSEELKLHQLCSCKATETARGPRMPATEMERGSDERASEERGSDERASEERGSDERASEERGSDERASEERGSLPADNGRRKRIYCPVCDTSGCLAPERQVLIDGRQLKGDLEVQLPDAETTFCQYVEDGEQNPATKYKLRLLESAVFYLETAVSASASVASHFKLRPGVVPFLREMAKYFEMYIYTAGIREHANCALSLLDPDRRWFPHDHVFSRDAVSMRGTKNLSRVLPSDHHAILVVDDTPAAWDDDVGLFVCYPYVWFASPLDHFTTPLNPYSLDLKVSAFRRALCQYGPLRILNALKKAGKYQTAQDTSQDATQDTIKEQETTLSGLKPLSDGTSPLTPPLEERTPRIHNPFFPDSLAGRKAAPTQYQDEYRGSALQLQPFTWAPPFERLPQLWREQNIEARCGENLPRSFKDSDLQLYCLRRILKLAHKIYFAALDAQGYETELTIPSLKDILDVIKLKVLQSTRPFYGDPPHGWSKTQSATTFKFLGAEVIHNDEIRTPTHILLNRLDVVPPHIQLPTVTQDWLEFAASTLIAPDDEVFSPNNARELRVFWDACVLEQPTSTECGKRQRTSGICCVMDDTEWLVKHRTDENELIEAVLSRSTVKRPVDIEKLEDDLLQELEI